MLAAPHLLQGDCCFGNRALTIWAADLRPGSWAAGWMVCPLASSGRLLENVAPARHFRTEFHTALRHAETSAQPAEDDSTTRFTDDAAPSACGDGGTLLSLAMVMLHPRDLPAQFLGPFTGQAAPSAGPRRHRFAPPDGLNLYPNTVPRRFDTASPRAGHRIAGTGLSLRAARRDPTSRLHRGPELTDRVLLLGVGPLALTSRLRPATVPGSFSAPCTQRTPGVGRRYRRQRHHGCLSAAALRCAAGTSRSCLRGRCNSGEAPTFMRWRPSSWT